MVMSSQAMVGLEKKDPFSGSDQLCGAKPHFAAAYWTLLSRNQKINLDWVNALFSAFFPLNRFSFMWQRVSGDNWELWSWNITADFLSPESVWGIFMQPVKNEHFQLHTACWLDGESLSQNLLPNFRSTPLQVKILALQEKTMNVF